MSNSGLHMFWTVFVGLRSVDRLAFQARQEARIARCMIFSFLIGKPVHSNYRTASASREQIGCDQPQLQADSAIPTSMAAL